MELAAASEIRRVRQLPLLLLWQAVKDSASVTRKEFNAYFDGLEMGVAIELANAKELVQRISLEDLRCIWPGFKPPQGFCYIDESDYEQVAKASRNRKGA